MAVTAVGATEGAAASGFQVGHAVRVRLIIRIGRGRQIGPQVEGGRLGGRRVPSAGAQRFEDFGKDLLAFAGYRDIRHPASKKKRMIGRDLGPACDDLQLRQDPARLPDQVERAFDVPEKEGCRNDVGLQPRDRREQAAVIEPVRVRDGHDPVEAALAGLFQRVPQVDGRERHVFLLAVRIVIKPGQLKKKDLSSSHEAELTTETRRKKA